MDSYRAANPPPQSLRKGRRQWVRPKISARQSKQSSSFDPLVDDADIHVVNMNGDVALNGTVPSYPQYLEAAAAAQRVAGVKNVHNHLEVVLPRRRLPR